MSDESTTPKPQSEQSERPHSLATWDLSFRDYKLLHLRQTHEGVLKGGEALPRQVYEELYPKLKSLKSLCPDAGEEYETRHRRLKAFSDAPSINEVLSRLWTLYEQEMDGIRRVRTSQESKQLFDALMKVVNDDTIRYCCSNPGVIPQEDERSLHEKVRACYSDVFLLLNRRLGRNDVAIPDAFDRLSEAMQTRDQSHLLSQGIKVKPRELHEFKSLDTPGPTSVSRWYANGLRRILTTLELQSQTGSEE